MPCERKHVEAIRARYRSLDGKISGTASEDSIDRASEALDETISAALAACDESPWRSMDSAPKDGTNYEMKLMWRPLPAAPEVGNV